MDEELLEFLYQIPVGIVKTNLKGDILLLNPVATNILMSINPDFKGELPNLFDIFILYDKFFKEKIIDKIEKKVKIIFENYDININKFGIIKIRIKCVRLVSDSLIFVIENISRLIELEEKNKFIEKQLDSQEKKLIKIGQSIRGIIHDLRNPISNIQLLSEMSQFSTPEELKSIFDSTIKNIIFEMNSLIGDLLDYTKIQTLNLIDLPVERLVEHLKIKFEYFTKEYDIPFDLKYQNGVIIKCDEQKIIRVFNNICGNAAKALSKMKLENPLIKVEITEYENKTKIVIADNGTGIPVELLDKLFDPFAFKSEYVGNGIGLSIVKDIVDLHNGSIDVISSKNGTIFTIII